MSREATRDARGSWHEVFDFAQVAVVISTPDGRVVDANSTFLSLCGYSLDELGELGTDVLYPKDARRDFLATLRQKGEVRHREMELTAKSGVTRWFAVSSRLALLAGEERIVSIAIDINRRKQSEQALLAREKRLRTLVERSPTPIVILAADGSIEESNQSFLDLWNVDENELPRFSSRYNVFDDDQLARLGLEPLIQRAYNGEAVDLPPALYDSRDTERQLGLDGSGGRARWVKGCAYPLLGDQGAVEHVVLELQDLTERKLAEEALLESEARFRTLFEKAADAIGVSVDGVNAAANPAYAELFRHTDPDRVIGTRILDHIAPEERPRIQEYMQRRAGGEPAPDLYETRGLRRDGTTFDMEVRIGTYEVDGMRQTVAILRDVTERKRAERALADSEARYRAVFENSSDGILIAEIASRGLLYANPAACRLFGYEPEEIISLHLSDIHPAEVMADIDAVFEGRSEKWQQNPSLMREMPCLRKDGKVVFADVSASAIKLDGRPCAVAFFRDVTDRRLLSELEEKTAELETFNQAMIGREGRIIELKEEVNWLSAELGREPPYEAIWRGLSLSTNDDPQW